MRLSRYSIIVAIDRFSGIAKDGAIVTPPDAKYFKDVTVGSGKNAVVMGRITYESIPPKFRPLVSRKNIVVSKTMCQEDNAKVIIKPNLGSALEYCALDKSIEKVYIAGGEQIYEQCFSKYMYLCDEIYITRFPDNCECDQHFPLPPEVLMNTAGLSQYSIPLTTFKDTYTTPEFSRFFLRPICIHPEEEYKKLLSKILECGEHKIDRTGVGTLSLFAETIKFDLRGTIPIITLRKINYMNIIKELLFFISGQTDTKILENKGVKIWKANTSRQFLDDRNLDYPEGEMGPGYSFQWRKWGQNYEEYLLKKDPSEKGIDQLDNAIKMIKHQPTSRRICVSAWNVSDLEKMALPPCHLFYQFHISKGSHLDCNVIMRSCDMALGFCYNLTSYALLVYMIAHLTGLKPGTLSFQLGDAHIYDTHISGVKRMLKRTPKPFPNLYFRKADSLRVIDDFTEETFLIEGYDSWDTVKFEMAV
ncbi:MAG TPA: thymidylate synthase [Nitrosarchaeum sp.]|nr:thymidylate synthase [Nitrosarchaeum sp.]